METEIKYAHSSAASGVFVKEPKSVETVGHFQLYLIELENIKQVKKLPVLLAVLQLAVILLQTM